MTETPATRPPTGDLEERPPSWFVESVERRFEIGDRVRVRISGECEYCTEDWRRGLDGREMIVHAVEHDDDPNYGRDSVWARQYAAHHIWTSIEGCQNWELFHFAPTELEPVTPPHGAAVSQEGEQA